jgi:UDP-galactopyranose mutase
MTYLIVGAGITGCTIAERLADMGHNITIIDKRPYIGGNCASYGINEAPFGDVTVEYHKHGPHIFHTSDRKIWNYINRFASFKTYINPVLSYYQNKYYQFPINLKTINDFFGKQFDSDEAEDFIYGDSKHTSVPKNAQDAGECFVGKQLYRAFYKDYTEKQWGIPGKKLPPGIISRIPIRFNYKWGYYDDLYHGLPTCGYNKMFANMLNHARIQIHLNIDFSDMTALHGSNPKEYHRIIYTGPIDKFFNYCHGKLEWRSLTWKIKEFSMSSYQRIGVVNYPEKRFLYTRSIEFKQFGQTHNTSNTIVFFEYPKPAAKDCDEIYYPTPTEINRLRYEKYKSMAKKFKNVWFAGRLGTYRYLDMDDAVKEAMSLAKTIIGAK